MLGTGEVLLRLNHRFGLGGIWGSGPTVGTAHKEEDSEISAAGPPGEQGKRGPVRAIAWCGVHSVGSRVALKAFDRQLAPRESFPCTSVSRL